MATINSISYTILFFGREVKTLKSKNIRAKNRADVVIKAEAWVRKTFAENYGDCDGTLAHYEIWENAKNISNVIRVDAITC